MRAADDMQGVLYAEFGRPPGEPDFVGHVTVLGRSYRVVGFDRQGLNDRPYIKLQLRLDDSQAARTARGVG